MSAMSDRERLIREAFAAMADGDLGPFERLFDPEAKWVGIPGGGNDGGTATCANRAAILDRLRRIHANGRRFQAEKVLEEGDRVAVAVRITDPSWSSPVTIFRVFAFREGSDVVVRLNDCLDESYALQVLVA
jgi:ketosteroid isomerase-like protein